MSETEAVKFVEGAIGVETFGRGPQVCRERTVEFFPAERTRAGGE